MCHGVSRTIAPADMVDGGGDRRTILLFSRAAYPTLLNPSFGVYCAGDTRNNNRVEKPLKKNRSVNVTHTTHPPLPAPPPPPCA